MLNFKFQGDDFMWLDYANPGKQELEQLKSDFRLHSLAVNECLSPEIQRPKLMHFDGILFFLDNHIFYNKNTNFVEVQEVGYFLGKKFFVSLHRQPAPLLQKVLHFVHSEGENQQSIEKIFYLILHETVDQQFAVLDCIDKRIDALEETILTTKGDKNISAAFFSIKKNLINVKKILAPRRDCLTKMIRANNQVDNHDYHLYFLDIFDHALRALDTVQTQVDTLNGVLEIYLTTISNRTNDIVKMLTLLATLAVPITVIATIYGMNFKSIPEFDWPYGYLYFWSLSLATTGALYYYLRKRNWF